MLFPHRGEIYMIEFRAVAGSEITGWHPALIIQNNVGNRVSPVTIVAAVTSKMGAARLPNTVLIDPADSGLPLQSLVHCGQLYTIDKSRIGPRVGQLTSERLEAVDHALAISLGLVAPPPPRQSPGDR
jgi:mRNA interferase MazF